MVTVIVTSTTLHLHCPPLCNKWHFNEFILFKKKKEETLNVIFSFREQICIYVLWARVYTQWWNSCVCHFDCHLKDLLFFFLPDLDYIKCAISKYFSKRSSEQRFYWFELERTKCGKDQRRRPRGTRDRNDTVVVVVPKSPR